MIKNHQFATAPILNIFYQLKENEQYHILSIKFFISSFEECSI